MILCNHGDPEDGSMASKSITQKVGHKTLTLNTSEKNPAPIFSRLKSSMRARLDTALRRARYEDGLIRLVPWTLCMGGSASPSCSCSGSTLSVSISISDAPGGEGGRRRTWDVCVV